MTLMCHDVLLAGLVVVTRNTIIIAMSYLVSASGIERERELQRREEELEREQVQANKLQQQQQHGAPITLLDLALNPDAPNQLHAERRIQDKVCQYLVFIYLFQEFVKATATEEEKAMLKEQEETLKLCKKIKAGRQYINKKSYEIKGFCFEEDMKELLVHPKFY